MAMVVIGASHNSASTAGWIVITCLVFLVWGIAWGVKHLVIWQGGTRARIFEALSGYFNLDLHHYRFDGKPYWEVDMFDGWETHLKTHGKDGGSVMSLAGWEKLHTDGDSFRPIDNSTCYVAGTLDQLDVLIADMCVFSHKERRDNATLDHEPEYLRHFNTEHTGIAILMTETDYPRCSVMPRFRGMPKGVQLSGFPGSVQFNKKVFIDGPDAQAVREFFDRSLAEWFTAHPTLSLELLGSAFIVYRGSTLMSAEEVKKTVEAAKEMVTILACDH